MKWIDQDQSYVYVLITESEYGYGVRSTGFVFDLCPGMLVPNLATSLYWQDPGKELCPVAAACQQITSPYNHKLTNFLWNCYWKVMPHWISIHFPGFSWDCCFKDILIMYPDWEWLECDHNTPSEVLSVCLFHCLFYFCNNHWNDYQWRTST